MSDISREARALLDSAMPGLEPDDDARSRIRTKIAARVAVSLAAGAAVAAASKSTAGATAATVAASAGGATAATASAVGAGAAGASAVAAGASAGAGVAGAAVTMGITSKVIASLAVVSAVSVGTITYTQTKKAEPRPIVVAATVATTAATSAPAPTVARARSNGAPLAAADDPAALPDPTPVADPTPVVRVAPSTVPLIPTPPVLPAPASSATLAAEVTLLKQANAELTAGHASRALALLDEHRRLYPRGALGEERDAARVLALCGAGRHSEGIAARGRFLQDHPASPQIARVQNACTTPGGGIQRDFP